MKGTIKSKEDIERLFQSGRRSSSSSVTIIALENPEQEKGRCAYIAGKKLGNAPFRSRCKRVLRQTARNIGAPIPGYDIVFIARRSAATKNHRKIEAEIKGLLGKLRIIDE